MQFRRSAAAIDQIRGKKEGSAMNNIHEGVREE
jgi:hypothetical protein